VKRRILIAPDKFKGTATAIQAADALEKAVLAHCVQREPEHLEIVKMPMADGGDGSLALIERAFSQYVTRVEVPAFDALLRPISAPMLRSGDDFFIEMAQVCGLAALRQEERNPEQTSTFGLGVLIRKAAELGAKRILLGIGGSATNDGGEGMMCLEPGRHVTDADLAWIDAHIRGKIEVLVACDVNNPLLGINGATMVFGPQKGADAAMLERLERRMEAFATRVGLDPLLPGGGAAGGVGAALAARYGARLIPGWQLFSRLFKLEEQIAAADDVITGEGRFDAQSLSGKMIDGIAGLCRQYRKPLFVVCGRNTVPYKVWHKAGITDLYTLQEVEPDPTRCYHGTQQLLAAEGIRIAGCDEAGRGCLAGPVFAAAVILPEGFYHPKLNDSKQMSEKEREELREVIEREALAWSVVAVSAEEIDRINILNASITGMQRALDGLSVTPQQILVDGNRFRPYVRPDGSRIPFHCVVHGDARSAAIAAASVLAKTHRDEFMRKIAREYPAYGWDRNMAYPTAEHREAIRKYGITPYHRKSYKLD
jgi:ribonuclease HII